MAFYKLRLNEISEPTIVSQALESPQWKKDMAIEYKDSVQNNTWELVPYKGQKIVDCKWIFKTKYKENGKVEWHKARLVAKGFKQDPG